MDDTFTLRMTTGQQQELGGDPLRVMATMIAYPDDPGNTAVLGLPTAFGQIALMVPASLVADIPLSTDYEVTFTRLTGV